MLRKLVLDAYKFMTPQHNAAGSQKMKTVTISFANVAKFKYLGLTLTN
jgi:hypothetical protein